VAGVGCPRKAGGGSVRPANGSNPGWLTFWQPVSIPADSNHAKNRIMTGAPVFPSEACQKCTDGAGRNAQRGVMPQGAQSIQSSLRCALLADRRQHNAQVDRFHRF
jgi:hypothetical protein